MIVRGSYFAWALPFIPYAIFEEIGWRGFALPKLQKTFTPLKASIIIGIIDSALSDTKEKGA